jgi:hypothetical protein
MSGRCPVYPQSLTNLRGATSDKWGDQQDPRAVRLGHLTPFMLSDRLRGGLPSSVLERNGRRGEISYVVPRSDDIDLK